MNTVPEDKIKGMLITRTAIKLLQSEDIVEKIINFQFKDANSEIITSHQIEFSGLGKVMISPSKIRTKIAKMENSIKKFNREIEDPTCLPRMIALRKKQIGECERALIYLKQKNQRYEN